jgi:hypothetical protein
VIAGIGAALSSFWILFSPVATLRTIPAPMSE